MLAYVVLNTINQYKHLEGVKMSLSPEAIQSDKDIIVNFFGNIEIYTSKGVLRELDFNSPKASRVVAYLLLHRKTAHPPLEIATAIWPEDDSSPDSTINNIAAITTADKGQYLPSHIFLGENYGLDRPSTVMLEQIRTVNQEELGTYIGVIEDEQMLRTIAKGIKKTLGMWHYQSSRDEIRCLCKSCLMEYMDTNQYIINRLDPFQRDKEPCDRCNRPGYDYTLKQRRKKE